MIADFRSDTVTRPGPGMLEAMQKAKTGDDVFREDPTVNELEEKMAKLFGMEAAMYCLSGTMSNQVAIASHTRPGYEVICERESHVYFYEGGGIARNAGCQVRTLAGDRGRINAGQVLDSINPDDVHRARTSLVCLENTSNRGGGSCYDTVEIQKIRDVCNERRLLLHLDGARLFNAMVAKQEEPLQYGKWFDSISVCFNKGLGCPAGSMLMGTSDFIRQARRVRKVFGGGLRQAGFYAATALFALEHNVERLKDDHLRAGMIADALAAHPLIKLVAPAETNLIIFEFDASVEPSHFISSMKAQDILLFGIGNMRLRIVTHMDITDQMVERFLSALKSFR